jgi:hypothetical protein
MPRARRQIESVCVRGTGDQADIMKRYRLLAIWALRLIRIATACLVGTIWGGSSFIIIALSGTSLTHSPLSLLGILFQQAVRLTLLFPGYIGIVIDGSLDPASQTRPGFLVALLLGVLISYLLLSPLSKMLRRFGRILLAAA